MQFHAISYLTANKVPGQKNLYYGKAADTDALLGDQWKVTKDPPPAMNKSVDFARFIRTQYPEDSVSNWSYYMQEMTSPSGDTIQNHYWGNDYDHPGEYYHHHW